MKLWFNTSNIVYEAILWELIRKHDDLWEDYVNYWLIKVSNQEKIKHLNDIKSVFWINFDTIKDHWVYQNKYWNIGGFIRGNHTNDGTSAGAVSLFIKSHCNGSFSGISFRHSV